MMVWGRAASDGRPVQLGQLRVYGNAELTPTEFVSTIGADPAVPVGSSMTTMFGSPGICEIDVTATPPMVAAVIALTL